MHIRRSNDLCLTLLAAGPPFQKAQQEAREAALEAEASDEDSDSPCHSQNPHKGSKFARAYAKSYTLGPPLVPNLILTRLLAYVGKISIRKKQDFVALVCRYWSLKREARRGAPLLKRLHLEPWGVGPAVEALATSDSDTLKHDKEFKLDVRCCVTISTGVHC